MFSNFMLTEFLPLTQLSGEDSKRMTIAICGARWKHWAPLITLSKVGDIFQQLNQEYSGLFD